jgi:uncharacterized membrane protein
VPACLEANEGASTIMSEHQKQTEFLTQCLVYDGTAESHKLAERIAQVQQDERRVQRGLRLMAGLAGLAIVGLCYSAVFLAYYPQNMLGFMMNFITQVFCVLGLVSTICLLVFVYLGVVYRKQLDQRLEECRQLVTKLMESRLGKPVITPLQDSRVGDETGGTVLIAAEVNGFPDKIESTAPG